ncbi:coiled-coil domain-containing protein 166-like [Pelodytes ibericus]
MPPKPPQKAARDSSMDVPAAVVGEDEVMVSAREAILQQEHNKLLADQGGLKIRLEQLRKENEFLQEEAERVREESQEYMSYMTKRSQRRQDAIVSLSDLNQRELEEISEEKKKLESQFQEEEDKLREQLLQREKELANLNREIEELGPMKELKREQLSHIKKLEEEVMATRGRHAEGLLRVKSAFLREKARCHQDSEHQLDHLSQAAQAEAKKALQEVSTRMKDENQDLRQELLHLIHQARMLQAQKQKVEEQNHQLRTEENCRQELRNLKLQLKIP